MLLEIEHRLAFAYDGYISESFLELRVQPKTTPDQTLQSFMLAVGPPSRVARYRDWHDNTIHHFNVTRFHNRIEVVSRSLVATRPVGPALRDVDDPLPLADPPFTLYDFLQLGGPVRPSSRLRKFHRALPRRASTLGAAVERVSEHIRAHVTYRKDVTTYTSTTDDVLAAGAGVCQDFAHLMLGSLRLSGIPCRYVSGYLHVDRQHEEPSQSHAWIEFYSPRHGWVPFDPTHHRPLDEHYVVVAHGRSYDDVPPNKGIYRGAAREALTAQVHTRPTTPRRVGSLQEEIAPIEVPVFKEVPERRRETPATLAAVLDAADQQQQQQQQQ